MIKKLFYAFALCSYGLANATNYYLSNSGNDSNSGTSSGSPWQTITKLNTKTLAAGDSVFFKCGDVFRGDIVVSQSGNSSAPIVYTSYGAGAKPIISGAELISTWTQTGNYYSATYSSTYTITNFFVNNKEQTIARYPNEHSYLTLDSAQTTYLKDASLASVNSNLITGSRVCVHSSQWSWENASVSAYASNKITFGGSMLRAINNYGYFLYNNFNHLDTANEWFNNSSTHTLYYYPPTSLNPNSNTCEVSVYNNAIELGSFAAYITIKNLSFQKQANSAVYLNYSNNKGVVINNCDFMGQYKYAVYAKGKYCQVSNCTIRDVDGIAVYIAGGGNGSVVSSNTFRNNGVTRCNGLGGQLNGTSLMCASDSNYFHHNNIDSSGYCGISADGAHNLVERNIIDHSVLVENDGGGIKGWGAATTNTIYRNNFINHGDGNTEGTYNASFITPAFYFDFNLNNCNVSYNTIYNHSKKGIFQNSSVYNNTISNNVVYGGSNLLDLNGTNLAPTYTPITGMNIKHNTFFSRDNNSIIIRQVDYSNNFNTGSIDSNFYFQPYNTNYYGLRIINTTPTYYNFSNWQATGNDAHTKSSFVNWVYPTDSSQIFMNQTDNVSSVPLGNNYYVDLNGNPVCGNLTLQPYTSQVLILKNGSCSTGINKHNVDNGLLIFPNPTNSLITIQTKKESLGQISIYNTIGALVYSYNSNNQTHVFDMSNYPAGVYFVHTNGGIYKVIKS